MPKPIEKAVYKTIEWNLHNVSTLKRIVEEKRSEVLQGSGPDRDPGVPSGTSKHSDPTAVKALSIVDCRESLWLSVISATYAYYADFTPEGRMARLFYGHCVSVDAVSEEMGVDRRTISYYRDGFVMRCALFAAEKRLITFSDGGRSRDKSCVRE